MPPAVRDEARYIAPNVVLMPSYVNIGAYVDSGTMVDTWATVGSCCADRAQRSSSGGVGIGGVLEPLQANPTIVEDNCFIGARSEVVESVIVEENSVLGMGVFIGQSTRSTTGRPARSATAAFPPGPSSSPGRCPRPKAIAPSIARSSSSRSMREPGPRPASTSCCARDARVAAARERRVQTQHRNQ